MLGELYTPFSAKKPRWTKEEDELLLLHYGHNDIQEHLPRRTHIAIMKRALIKGIKSPIVTPKTLTSLENLSDFNIGWLVGIIEGEGMLTLSNRKKPRPIITITNTDKSIINKARELLTIGYIITDHREERPNATDSYTLVINGVSRVYSILKKLTSHFVSDRKKRLCNLLLQFCNLVISRYGMKRTPEERTIQEEIFSQVKNLNQRLKSES